MGKRILLFVLTNFLIMAMLSVVLSVLGIRPYLTAQGLDYGSLMAFCAVWGMGGSLISLMLSKTMAKWMMGVQIIDPSTTQADQRELVALVHRLAASANLPKMPEVGVYESPEVNAFATGPSRANSLVAVSTGLLARMNRGELEGVLGHEVTHIANGDMVTMTLLQGVVNAFVMFFARIVAFAVAQAMRGDNERSPSFLIQQLLVFVFDMAFGLLGSMVVCAFSRHREFRADYGGARLAGRDRMIGALDSLRRAQQLIDSGHPSFQSLKIAGAPKGIMAFLTTHPPLEVRIERLKQAQI